MKPVRTGSDGAPDIPYRKNRQAEHRARDCPTGPSSPMTVLAGGPTMTARDILAHTCRAVVAVSASLPAIRDTFAQAPVEAEFLSSLRISITRSMSAELISLREATMASRPSSAVTALPAPVGDRVEQYSLLCTDLQKPTSHVGRHDAPCSSY